MQTNQHKHVHIEEVIEWFFFPFSNDTDLDGWTDLTSTTKSIVYPNPCLATVFSYKKEKKIWGRDHTWDCLKCQVVDLKIDC